MWHSKFVDFFADHSFRCSAFGRDRWYRHGPGAFANLEQAVCKHRLPVLLVCFCAPELWPKRCGDFPDRRRPGSRQRSSAIRTLRNSSCANSTMKMCSVWIKCILWIHMNTLNGAVWSLDRIVLCNPVARHLSAVLCRPGPCWFEKIATWKNNRKKRRNKKHQKKHETTWINLNKLK